MAMLNCDCPPRPKSVPQVVFRTGTSPVRLPETLFRIIFARILLPVLHFYRCVQSAVYPFSHRASSPLRALRVLPALGSCVRRVYQPIRAGSLPPFCSCMPAYLPVHSTYSDLKGGAAAPLFARFTEDFRQPLRVPLPRKMISPVDRRSSHLGLFTLVAQDHSDRLRAVG